MPRFAMKITEDVINMACQLTNADPVSFEGELYLLIEMIGEGEFNAKFVTSEFVFEEFKKDSSLHIM